MGSFREDGESMNFYDNPRKVEMSHFRSKEDRIEK